MRNINLLIQIEQLITVLYPFKREDFHVKFASSPESYFRSPLNWLKGDLQPNNPVSILVEEKFSPIFIFLINEVLNYRKSRIRDTEFATLQILHILDPSQIFEAFP